MALGRKSKKHDIDDLDTVQFWPSQINDTGVKHYINTNSTTRTGYRHNLSRFNDWLAQRDFNMRVATVRDGKMARDNVTKSFKNVEELLYFADNGNGNDKEARKIVMRYMVAPCIAHPAAGSKANVCTAIKSYFSHNDVVLNVKHNKNGSNVTEYEETPELSLPEFYKMTKRGNGGANANALFVRLLSKMLERDSLDDETREEIKKFLDEFDGLGKF